MKPSTPVRLIKKRILIVNAFFDDLRINGPNPNKIPQAMGPVYLAGAFSRDSCEVRIYNEHYSGPLEDAALLGWPDMLLLTGLSVAFDRMLHLTAYARTKNPKVIVVAGGPAIRALSRHSQKYFDYSCRGDIEQIGDVIVDALGRGYLAESMMPRYDLMQHFSSLGYIETSRNCNFKCTFCSLTGEGSEYQHYSLENIRQQVYAMGKKHHVVLIDNNFYGNDRSFFLSRLELLAELREQGYFRGWSALVSGDFFARDDNLVLARNAGCECLFSGLESFDSQLLRQYNKRQNTILQQADVIRKCQQADIVFTYGIMLDVSRRRLADIRSEIDFVLTNPEITLPSFFSLTIPLPGTLYFDECAQNKTLLPDLRLRDLDGFTITTVPLDPIEEVVSLVRYLPSLKGYRRKALAKGLGYIHRNWRRLSSLQKGIVMTNVLLLCMPRLNNNPTGLRVRSPPRTHIGGREVLDSVYTPAFKVDSKFEDFFNPTMVTDAAGQPTRVLNVVNPASAVIDVLPNEIR